MSRDDTIVLRLEIPALPPGIDRFDFTFYRGSSSLTTEGAARLVAEEIRAGRVNIALVRTTSQEEPL